MFNVINIVKVKVIRFTFLAHSVGTFLSDYYYYYFLLLLYFPFDMTPSSHS